MRQARAVEVTLVVHEHLRLVDQPSEGTAVNNAIAVTLIFTTEARRRFAVQTSVTARLMLRVGRKTGIRVGAQRLAHATAACSSANKASSG